MAAFLAMLNPMLVMFICVAIGYALRKANVVPSASARVLAILETWVFAPSLSFITMARSFTVESLGQSGIMVALGAVAIAIVMLISIPLGRLLAGKPEHYGVFIYGITLGNFGYLCDPVILSLFGENVLAYYKFFTLSMTVLVYTWGISLLTPKGKEKGNALKRIINCPMVATFLGMLVGITGLYKYLPEFFVGTLDSLKVCLGPVAMLLAGMTMAGYGIKELLKNKRVYVTTGIKLVLYPAFGCGLVFLLNMIFERVFNIELGNTAVFLALFAFGCPLGLNTVVFPESFGTDSRPGASMTIISSTLSVITMSVCYALLVLLVGEINLG